MSGFIAAFCEFAQPHLGPVQARLLHLTGEEGPAR